MAPFKKWVQVRVAPFKVTERVRAAPYTETYRVRVAPFTKTVQDTATFLASKQVCEPPPHGGCRAPPPVGGR